MKCCDKKTTTDNYGDKQNIKNKRHISHMLMMLICCGAPILLLLLISIMGRITPGGSGFLVKILPFLCPVMMLLMLPIMLKKDKVTDNENKHSETKQIEGENS